MTLFASVPSLVRALVVICLLNWTLVTPASAGNDEGVDYIQDVKPILSRRCYSCHGALKQKNGLRLDTADLAKRGGAAGPAVVPGNTDESLLLEAIDGGGATPRMPPEGEPLTADEIKTIRTWIELGAKSPTNEAVPQDPTKHWAYQTPVRSVLPSGVDPVWENNPIDRFVAARHRILGVKPSSPAEKQVLLRRVYFDLIGLPPTRDELRAFLADASDDAYEKVVDRLLLSPQYGERWGRHWMDVWRYSDWDGFGAEVRESKPHIWRWRDWIVESLNADKGYDQMIREMLAGDELAPDDPTTVRATGFLVRNWYSFNRNVWLDATIEHTGKAFLATTFNCAKCHDHMYDPIAQTEYYQLRAFFETHDVRTDPVPGQPDVTKDGLARVFDANLESPTYVFRRGDEKQPIKEEPLQSRLPRLFATNEFRIDQVELPATAYYPGLREFSQSEATAQAQQQFDSAMKARIESVSRFETAKKLYADFRDKSPSDAPAKPRVVFEDDFSAKRDDAWKADSGVWEWSDGKLQQKLVQNSWTGLLSTAAHPSDFRLKVRLRSTGGNVYKSVGVCFDATDNANLQGVYISVSGKIQLFHRVNGADSYPADAAKVLPIELNRDYEIEVAVVGRQVNISLDGALVVAYALPADRPTGSRYGLWTYDATAEYKRFELSELPASYPLIAKIGETPTAVTEEQLRLALDSAEKHVRLAERSVDLALSNRLWVQSRIQADKAQYTQPPSPLARELAQTAALSERDYNLKRAEVALAESNWKLAEARRTPGNAAPIAAAEMAVAAATKSRDTALESVREASDTYSRFGTVYPNKSSGRRSALAAWITNKSNPLTARVAINHLWLRHFGSPLVPSVFDFGLNGKSPTHPELLDWLAVELMDQGWKMKAIHRMMVTSQTYRQRSQGNTDDAHNRTTDPDNLTLWRFNSRRLEAEAVRDATLSTSGSIDLTPGGPELSENLGMQSARRSLYFRNTKEKKMTFLDTFDRPNVVDCYRRSESIIPQQALALANSPLSIAESRRLAAQLTQLSSTIPETDNVAAFISIAFEQILTRSPTADEVTTCSEFVAGQTKKYSQPESLQKFTTGTPAHIPPSSDPHQRARENLIHVLLNHNDFITIR